LQAKVGPALHKLDQALESVESQAVIPVVGQVGHEDADLETAKTGDTGKSGNGAASSQPDAPVSKGPFTSRTTLAGGGDTRPSARRQHNLDENWDAAWGRRDADLSVTPAMGWGASTAPWMRVQNGF